MVFRSIFRLNVMNNWQGKNQRAFILTLQCPLVLWQFWCQCFLFIRFAQSLSLSYSVSSALFAYTLLLILKLCTIDDAVSFFRCFWLNWKNIVNSVRYNFFSVFIRRHTYTKIRSNKTTWITHASLALAWLSLALVFANKSYWNFGWPFSYRERHTYTTNSNSEFNLILFSLAFEKSLQIVPFWRMLFQLKFQTKNTFTIFSISTFMFILGQTLPKGLMDLSFMLLAANAW